MCTRQVDEILICHFQFDDVAARGADAFVSTYYKLMRSERNTLLDQIYKNDAAILWNGHAYGNKEKFQEFMKGMPVTGIFDFTKMEAMSLLNL